MYISKTSKNLHKIVVVGGGAGGLELVTFLGRSLRNKGLAQPILVDRTLTHIWKPLLHEVAAGSLNTGEDELNYYSHAYRNGYDFHIGKMHGLDREKKLIHIAGVKDFDGKEVVKERTLNYDTLVMAVGSTSNSFGIEGVAKHCITLDSVWQAEKLRKKFLSQSLAVIMNNRKGGPETQMRVGIVGGGATGVELAAEIQHTTVIMQRFGAEFIPERVKISVLEAGPRLLGATSDSLSNYAKKLLEKRDIDVRTDCQIKSVNERGFVLGDGSLLEKEIKVWTAGVKAPGWLKTTGLQITRANNIKVNENLQTLDDSNIYAIGDCACAPTPGDPERCLPPTAQVAHQQAEWLAKKLTAQLKGQTCPPFQYHPKGILVSLGSGKAVGSVAVAGKEKHQYVQGRGAKIIYSSLYHMHRAALYGYCRAFFLFLGDKLRKGAMPPLKLH